MNIFADVTRLPRKVYWIAFFTFVIVATLLNFFVGEPPLGPSVAYMVGASMFLYILAFICLVLAFPEVFEAFLDILTAILVLAHILSFIAPSTANYMLMVPGIGLLFFFVAVGGWIVLYPYAVYRIQRRFKKKKPVAQTAPLQ